MKLHYWYTAIVSFTALTIFFAYVVPSDSLFVVFGYVFGFVFVTFVPGYCLVSILFATKRYKLDIVEEIVLSIALSFSLVGISGLFLGLSPVGINFNSIRISLSTIVLGLASVAYAVKWRSMRVLGAKP